MFSFPWTVTWIKSIFCLFVCFSYGYAYWVVSKGDKISELSEATRLEQTKTTKRPLSWIDISFPSMDETESLWSADPRSRRALDSMLLSLPDLRPMSQSSLAARSSPQIPKRLRLQASAHASSSVGTAHPSTPCLPICLASTYLPFKIQFKDHFIHSSIHWLFQSIFIEDPPCARTHTGYWGTQRWTIHGPYS